MAYLEVNPVRDRLPKATVGHLRCPISNGINICFVTDEEIRRLNSRYSGRNSSTDVLAFDLSNKKIAFGDNSKRFSVVGKVPYTFPHHEKDRLLSDIFISTDTAVSNSKNFKTTPLYETYLYLIHGMLHILGYDDRTARERAVMRKKEKEYLWQF